MRCRSCAASREETPRNPVLRVSPHKYPRQVQSRCVLETRAVPGQLQDN